MVLLTSYRWAKLLANPAQRANMYLGGMLLGLQNRAKEKRRAGRTLVVNVVLGIRRRMVKYHPQTLNERIPLACPKGSVLF
jgi:hypothetical protein